MVLGFEGGGRFSNTERLRNGRGYLFGGAGFTSGGKRRRIEPLSILAFSHCCVPLNIRANRGYVTVRPSHQA
jgi:hypothetical protein